MLRSSYARMAVSMLFLAFAVPSPATAETLALAGVEAAGQPEPDLVRRADAGDMRAQVSLARLLAEDNRVALAVRYWQLAEAQGHQGARYQLARALLSGEDVPADPEEGIRLLRLGAEAGHVSSIATLARALETGQDVQQDLPEAVQLYEIAAAEGHVYSRYRLALALSDRQSPTPDPTRAEAILSDLVDEGYRPAPFALAEFLMQGRPRGEQRDRALALWRAEALAGNDRALARLARAFPNDYITIVQEALREKGLYGGRINGLLTERTIAAIARYCRDAGINHVCQHGPMRSDSAREIGRNMFPVTR